MVLSMYQTRFDENYSWDTRGYVPPGCLSSLSDNGGRQCSKSETVCSDESGDASDCTASSCYCTSQNGQFVLLRVEDTGEDKEKKSTRLDDVIDWHYTAVTFYKGAH